MARKTGVDNCRTEYITFVDADAFILENSCIYAKEHMERNIDMIFFEIARYYGEGNIKRERILFCMVWGQLEKRIINS